MYFENEYRKRGNDDKDRVKNNLKTQMTLKSVQQLYVLYNV